jgi:hypothetical protein
MLSTNIPPHWTQQFYGARQFQLAVVVVPALYRRHRNGGQCKMATFNRIFSTQRLLQIILVLSATVIMKLLS